MTTESARKRNRKGSGGLLREDLIAEATAILAESGDENALSIREVARRARVSPPAVYLHFSDKTALVQAALESQFATLVRRVDEAISSTHDPAATLRAGCLAYVEFAHQQPGTYRLLFAGLDPEVDHRELDTMPGRAAFGQLVQGIQLAQDAGAIRPGDPQRDATYVWIGLHGMITLRQARPDFPWPPVEPMLDELLERLIGLPRD